MKWSLPIVLGAAFVLFGCNSGPKIYHVSGKVTYAGQPLPAGVIYFDPEAGKNTGPQGYAIIKNGEYSTAKEGGKGVTGGPFIVRIEGFDGKAGNDLPLGKVTFTDFQKSLDLPKADSVQDFEVEQKKKP